ncbi:PhoX family protein [Profundibacterium mesophilum]|uniref:Phosphatase General function prediction only n=1 Tax=Profundibacterium mesophilum KAUST100406-0324 TaxID=1037889 RepID=A0A921NQG5_9RHOB|nr:PhoX family phosphatase [Profundibacterium mesophilum]KAF0675332.1 putative phosphatase General function prediction only [Profundibacterium mesophilum KAUST100406-0324]
MQDIRPSFDDYDEINSPRAEQTDIDRVIETAISRRGFLGGAMSFGLGSFLVGSTALNRRAAAQTQGARFDFAAVEATTADTVTLPEGYEWKMLVKWGDPLHPDAPEFDPETRGTVESQARAFGDNNDGMALFTRDGRHVFAINNEYTNLDILWGEMAEGEAPTDEQIRKSMMAHGLSVFEIVEGADGWEVKRDSDLNRRVTTDTEMDIAGPAAGHDLLRTSADPEGMMSLGTWNNCGNGRTPWGTYLACEENFNGYYSSSEERAEDAEDTRSEAFRRYGINYSDWGYGWARVDPRFDISAEPNEPNRNGYVVELDPFDPEARPVKRTALGRFKHENAELVINDDGRVVVYMGDDERGEFLYRYVSEGTWAEGQDGGDLLDKGQLYVAVFDPEMTGKWVALTPDATGMSAPEIAIHTRIAASRVGATTMDRPEWVAANPSKPELYVALTNNKNRGVKPNEGGDNQDVNGPNPREVNNYGQILRWTPDNGDHTADGFEWRLFALAGNPVLAEALEGVTDAEMAEPADPGLAVENVYPGSENVTAGNMFNSPDCLAFDTRGMLWILTDGNYSDEGPFEGMGNNQMLAGDTETGEIRRFMVGPRECELTGMQLSPDGKTMFVGVQHPGEDGNSNFPDGGLPRSGVVMITRTDGGVMG